MLFEKQECILDKTGFNSLNAYFIISRKYKVFSLQMVPKYTENEQLLPFFLTKDVLKFYINSLIAFMEINIIFVHWKLFQTGSS